MMLHGLSRDGGVVQAVLDWFNSYLSDRVQYVHINRSTSPACPLTCGIPQGSELGPQLFSIYPAPAMAADSSASGIQDSVTHSSNTDWPCT